MFRSGRVRFAAVVASLVAFLLLSGSLVASDSALKPGGTLLLSGLLASQAEVVCEHYAAHITIGISGETDGWVCLQGTLPVQ